MTLTIPYLSGGSHLRERHLFVTLSNVLHKLQRKLQKHSLLALRGSGKMYFFKQYIQGKAKINTDAEFILLKGYEREDVGHMASLLWLVWEFSLRSLNTGVQVPTEKRTHFQTPVIIVAFMEVTGPGALGCFVQLWRKVSEK